MSKLLKFYWFELTRLNFYYFQSQFQHRLNWFGPLQNLVKTQFQIGMHHQHVSFSFTVFCIFCSLAILFLLVECIGKKIPKCFCINIEMQSIRAEKEWGKFYEKKLSKKTYPKIKVCVQFVEFSHFYRTSNTSLKNYFQCTQSIHKMEVI